MPDDVCVKEDLQPLPPLNISNHAHYKWLLQLEGITASMRLSQVGRAARGRACQIFTCRQAARFPACCLATHVHKVFCFLLCPYPRRPYATCCRRGRGMQMQSCMNPTSIPYPVHPRRGRPSTTCAAVKHTLLS